MKKENMRSLSCIIESSTLTMVKTISLNRTLNT